MSVIKTSTFPRGPHWQLEQNTIVQVLQGNGRFKDCYVGELSHGDEYYIPDLHNVPRPAEVLLAWLENHRIEIDYTFDMDGDKAIELTREDDRSPLVSYPFGEGSLAEAINFCMDLMERKG